MWGLPSLTYQVCSVSFWPVKLGIFLSSAFKKRERYEPKLIELVHQEPLQKRL